MLKKRRRKRKREKNKNKPNHKNYKENIGTKLITNTKKQRLKIQNETRTLSNTIHKNKLKMD